jgi:hypothetical protein
MPRLDDLVWALDVDSVLRAQAADPDVIRGRQPDLVEVADRALAEGLPLITPRVLYEQKSVIGIGHDWLELQGHIRLRGQSVCSHLLHADEVVLILCTVGEAIEDRIREIFGRDPVRALALDGVGIAALNALAAAAIAHFKAVATAQGAKVSVPLSPGIEGWSVEQGQAQLFSLLRAEEIGVRLTESCMMRPSKSLTMVLGVGTAVDDEGTACDFCVAREHCRYREVA